MTVRAIITDIEGTTSSLSFVKETLFPYARARMGNFLRNHHDSLEVVRQLSAVQAEVGSVLTLEQIIRQLEQWIDEDRKITPLKALQGMIWQSGYQKGELHGHIYADAVDALRRWHDYGIAIYVFSSGSVQAQKLLFGYSEAGDLTSLFNGYFDTSTGPKREADSYRKIIQAIRQQADEVLFLSDTLEELDAARSAGLQTAQLAREGQASTQRHAVAASFAAILP
jgi:enolase-phosphatase E1